MKPLLSAKEKKNVTDNTVGELNADKTMTALMIGKFV